MTKKDFQLIADGIAEQRGHVRTWDDAPRKLAATRALDNLTDWFASRLAYTNDRFDAKRFRHAAGSLP